ncbi:hypothetical protein [Streptomyces sp. NRRL B-24484]|uniref:hypothetical protein n=1 Tax=Streptomyces sp. NRRL B-24484 TaxID=1463833 RepID=UPI001F19861F|nr:hypothetical protein [Streptomyces sp. NRRL B-24484]
MIQPDNHPVEKGVSGMSGDSARSHDPSPAPLPTGTRVTVVRDPEWDGPWQREFEGTIDDFGPPESVDHPLAHRGELMYWVDFDDPQLDADGDGPYRRAQIWDRYLKPRSQA